MHKQLFFTLPFIISSSLVASNYIDIYSNSAKSYNGTTEANGDVKINSDEYNITADYIKVEQQNLLIKPYFIKTNKGVWFKGKETNKKDNKFKLKQTSLSSCDCKDPDWSIRFSSGDYNTKTKWVNTYHTKLYVGKVPILYTPYFGFPMDKTRRSGLLRPHFGYSTYEGFSYAHPIYYAPQLNYDLEYIPQYREKRGYGNFAKFRYVDSVYSKLNLTAGMFEETTSYKDRYNLKNDKHYGWSLDYDRTKLFSKSNGYFILILFVF